MRLLVSGLLLLGILGCAEGKPLSGELVVCFPPYDLPRVSREDMTGFDLDVARLIAHELARKLVLVWQPPPTRTEIEVSDVSYTLLLEGQCDLQLSVPGSEAISAIAAIALSQPYYGTAFELIPEDAGDALEDLRGMTIAVRSNTVAHIVVDRYGLPWTMKLNTREIIEAVKSGEAGAALIWGPDLALSKTGYSGSFAAPSVLKWNQHMAIKASDIDLIDDINDLLSDEIFSKKILEFLADHHIPVHAPFSETFRSSDLDKLN